LAPNEGEPGRIAGKLDTDHEPPRLLSVSSNEEVLLLYSSGRVSTFAVDSLPTVEAGGAWAWEQAALPDEPRAGETLVCIAPFSGLPVSSFFLQVSRRGCVKKTMTSLAQSILASHYLGKGALGKSDQPFDLSLCGAHERFAFVTYEGKLLGLEVDDLSYSAEERIKLSTTDYVIASFSPRLDDALLFVTQTGKVLHRESQMLEPSKSPSAKGGALISANRLEQGVRFIGAASVRDGDRLSVLDSSGQIKVYEAGGLIGAGSIGSGGRVLSIGLIPSQSGDRSTP
jgi:DNA gyrase/topoisomerase IV subunit A